MKYDKKLHEVEKILSFVDGGKPSREYKIELYPGEEDIKKVDKFWEEKNLSNKKIVVIAPGSRWFTKKWPLDYFNKVIKELEKKQDTAVLIVGGADEKGLNIEFSDSTIDLRGCTTLLGLSEVLKRVDIVLTNDSSPIHIASAWEKPHILAIFGPTVKEFGFTPWSLNSEILQVENLDCRPCAIHGGDNCPKGHFKCMLDITPEKVLDKLC